MRFHLDFETRSRLDLKKVGFWKYALDESTEILCAGYAIDNGPVTVLTAAEVKAGKLRIPEGATIIAHNAPFEYSIFNVILNRRLGYPALWDAASFDCTMARALMCGLPGGLDQCAAALNLPLRKDLDGKAALLKLCKPLPDGSWCEDKAVYERMYRYNGNDVDMERMVDDKLPPLPPAEKAVWAMDLAMNRAGIQVDLEMASKALATADVLTADINGRLKKMTGGFVDRFSQVARMKDFLGTFHGVQTDSLDKVAVTELLSDPALPAGAREVIRLRREAGKSSTAKYATILDQACSDGRVRGSQQYHAAHTGRWGGRGIQPHNFPQGFADPVEQARVVADIKRGDPELFSLLYGESAMETLADALRGALIAAPGKLLIGGDYNAIEARGVFWFAGEAEALASYSRGESPYLDMGKALYGYEIGKKTHPQEYDISKRTVLGAGFGMGPPRFAENIWEQTAAKGVGLRISAELSERAVKTYRTKYSKVPKAWREIEKAAISAVKYPGSVQPVCGGKAAWAMSRKWPDFLVCRLPSGRFLWYNKPSVAMAPPKTMTRADGTLYEIPAREELRYWAQDSTTKQWVRTHTYGGSLFENVVQATARDIMVSGMLNISAAAATRPTTGGGYGLRLTCHDELVSEIPVPALDKERDAILAEYLDLMCTVPQWAADYPVAAEGWIGERYRK